MRKLNVTNQSIAFFFVEKGIYPSDIGLIVPFIWRKIQNKTEMCAHFFAREKNSIVEERKKEKQWKFIQSLINNNDRKRTHTHLHIDNNNNRKMRIEELE